MKQGHFYSHTLDEFGIIDRSTNNLFKNLNPIGVCIKNLLELFFKTMDYLKKNYDLAIILISHDLDYVAKYADQVYLLDKTVIKHGKVKDVYQSPEFEAVFSKGEEKWFREEEKA